MSVTGLLALALLLIAGAAASLVYGWINVSEAPVIASIVCSAVSAMLLAMGLYRSRPPRVRKAPARRPQARKKARAGRSGR